jgi:D-alanyl-lipoteichoic acid acyltransferase DltB (MBOAT superfamily)
MQTTPKSITRSSTFLYGVRWCGAFVLMEVMMHLFYVVAIKDTKSWKGFSSLQIFTLGYFNLNFIWIKLLIIWRFFRLWALIDGIETQENMITCMSNNYSGIEFWRGWHASYNKWLIRYIYIPLGGSSRRLLNSFFIFTFVAIWHDIQLKMLAWGWLIVLFIVPELVCTQYFCTDQVGYSFA